MKRVALRRRSAKADAYEAELDALRPALMERCGGRCEIGGHFPLERRLVPHHRKRRSGGGPNTMDNLLMVCEAHHAFIHANPEWAYDRGLLIPSYGPITPYEMSLS